MRALLISTPWQQIEMPCVAICALAAYARQHSFDVDTFHACRRFHALLSNDSGDALNTSEGEAIGASLLFPNDRSRILRNMKRRYVGVTRLRKFALEAYRSLFEEVAWDKYRLIGFSITHGKLYFSLLMAKWIKEVRGNKVDIIAGGPRVFGQLGSILLEHARYIDAIVSGEGELPFNAILRQLSPRATKPNFKSVPGVSYMRGNRIESNCGQQISDINSLPVPYFIEYKQCLKSSSENLLPSSLCIEASRGCYNRCTFCTDILGWQGYRVKSPTKVINELKFLVRRFNVCDYYFVDRVTPCKEWWLEFSLLIRKTKCLRGITLHAEARPTIMRDQLIYMKRSGVSEVQLGCETLSSRVLVSMNKRSTVISNIQALKFIEELNFQTNNNFMIHFPNEFQSDVDECTRNIYHVKAYHPLEMPHNFILEFGSLVYQLPSKFGISNIIRKDMYGAYAAIPHFLLKRFGSTTYSFSRNNYVDYRKLKSAYLKWRNDYFAMRKDNMQLFTYRNLGIYGVVVDQRDFKKIHRLNAIQNNLVCFCNEMRSWSSIQRRFTSYSNRSLLSALDWLIKRDIIFKEGSYYLSLPIMILKRHKASSELY